MTLVEAYTYVPPEVLVITIWVVAFFLWMDVKRRGE